MIDSKKKLFAHASVMVTSAAMVLALLLMLERREKIYADGAGVDDKTLRNKLEIPATYKLPVIMQRDTIDTDGYTLRNTNRSNGLKGGYYKPGYHKVIIHHFRDTLAPTSYTTDSLRGYVNLVNEIFKYTDYHEVRHGLNDYYVGRVPDQNVSLHIANELWARVAEALAICYDMPPLPNGAVDMNVDYTAQNTQDVKFDAYKFKKRNMAKKYDADDEIFTNRDTVLNIMADLVLSFSVKGFKDSFHLYTDYLNNLNYQLYHRSARQNRHRAMTPDQAMDSMRVFIIDGQPRDIFDLASDNVRTQVTDFIDRWAPEELRRAKLIENTHKKTGER